MNIKEKIIKLYETVSELLNIITLENSNDIPYFCTHLNKMIQNLKICKSNNFESADEVINLVNQYWNYCFTPHDGLDEWFIWRNNFDERFILNQKVEMLKIQIDSLFDQ